MCGAEIGQAGLAPADIASRGGAQDKAVLSLQDARRTLMDVQSLPLADAKLLIPKRFQDDRGFFAETYNARAFEAAGVATRFVQDNESFSVKKGTLRGLHYQSPPYAQSKLVRVLKGAVLDVIVDARKGSLTFGQWTSAELSAENGAQLFAPAGFLHGFLTLTPNTHVAYKVDKYYDQPSDGAVRWDDPDLAIDWGVSADDVTLSDKDAKAPSWRDYARTLG